MNVVAERPVVERARPLPDVERERAARPWRRLASAPAACVRNAMAIVLAGGRGTRLAQLTDWRAKPAVSFGGGYRIIDFTLSNCVNSGLRRIGVCTRCRAQSLIGHLQRAWSFLDRRFDEFVELLPAQQRLEPVWYRGTADAADGNGWIRRFAEKPAQPRPLPGLSVVSRKCLYVQAAHEASASRARWILARISSPLAVQR
jgi:hypothetical protein